MRLWAALPGWDECGSGGHPRGSDLSSCRAAVWGLQGLREGELEHLPRIGSPQPWGFTVSSAGSTQQQFSISEPFTPSAEGWERIRKKVKNSWADMKAV